MTCGGSGFLNTDCCGEAGFHDRAAAEGGPREGPGASTQIIL